MQDVLELRLTAGPRGDAFGLLVWESAVMAGWSADQIGVRLRGELVDFIAETSFVGGEQRG